MSSPGWKKSAISAAADSGESEPWTRLNRLLIAKSPRIVPGAASGPKVLPIMARTTAMACLPSSTMATVGPLVTKRISGS